ncbi:MAG: hypothetical protein PVH69_01720 [Desulfobacterales bacterium]
MPGEQGAVWRAAEIDEFFGAEGIAMGDDDLHDLGQCLPLLAIHDVLLFLGERHLVGHFRISLLRLTTSVIESRLRLPVRAHRVHVRHTELPRIVRKLRFLLDSHF